MPPSRNNTVKFSDLAPISAVGAGDLIPVVDTSIPTLVNKKINVQDFSRSLPVSLQVTQLGTNSASWDSTYSTTLANSASWSTGGSYGSVYSANSAEYESTYTSLNANSANWDSTYTTVKESSAAWVGLTTFTTVNSLSNNWNTGYSLASSAYTSLNTLSTGYWILKSGDQMTGALTTTKTITANFTLDEFITKRYADALATATQISGNFVPSLYYTKNDFQTGIPYVSAATAVVASSFTAPNGVNVITGGGTTGVFVTDPFGHGVFSESGGIRIESGGGGASHRLLCGPWGCVSNISLGGVGRFAIDGLGKALFGRGSASSSLSIPLCAQFSIVNDRTMNSYTTDLLLLSSGPGTSPTFSQYFIRGIENDNVNFFVRKDGLTVLGAGAGYGGLWLYQGPNMSVAFDPTGTGGYMGLAPYMTIGWTEGAANGTRTTELVRPSPGLLDQRGGAVSQAYRIYNTFTDANNYERLSLSATRIAYERAGTGSVRDLTITTPGNLILSGASIQINSQLPFYYSSLSASRLRFDRSGYTGATADDPLMSAPFGDGTNIFTDGASNIRTGSGPSMLLGAGGYLYPFMGLATRINGANNTYNLWLAREMSLCWGNNSVFSGFNEGSDLMLFRDAPWTLAIRDRAAQNFTNALRIYNRYTDSSNYERLSLSATRIDYEFAGTGVKRDLEVGTGIIPTVTNAGDLGSSLKRWGHLYTVYDVVPGRDIAFDANTSRIVFRYYDSGGSSILRSDESNEINQRNATAPQRYRIYNTYTDANNYERLSLSATRIAYEAAGTGVSRDLTIQSTGNIVLSAGGLVNISSGIPTSFSNLAIVNDGRIYNAFASPAAHSIQFASNNFFFTGNNVRTLSIAENIAPGNGGIWMRSDRIVGWSSGGDPGNTGDLRLKRIGASSLALDSGGTANTPSFTVYGNISGSGSVQTLSSFIVEQNSNTNEITPELTGMWLVRNTARHGIASTYQGTAISMLGFYYNNVGIGGIQENGGFIVPSGAGFGWSNASAGFLTYPYARIGFFREGDFNIGLRPFNDAPSRSGFSDASLKIYKMFADTNNYERLALSGNRIAYEAAGTGVSRDLTIQSTGNIVLSAGGVINLSQALPTMFDNLSARILTVGPSDAVIGGSQGVLRVPTSPGATGYPGIIAYASNAPSIPTVPNSRISLATYGGMGYQNTSLTFANSLQVNRIIANPQGAILSPAQWDNETDIAIKVGGSIGFSVNQLDSSFQARPLSATMGYDWGTNLIGLSSRTTNNGFYFYPKSVQNGPCSIYASNNDNLYLNTLLGSGKGINVADVSNQGYVPFSVYYSGANTFSLTIQPYLYGGIATNTLLTLQQNVGQTGSYMRAINSSSSTIFEVNSANNVRVQNLLTFGNISSTGPAIKGTATTVQARTGDDSQYTFLQGKLQTDQAANAGTFTPDKYIILYDSTGTAYKVPVQAL